MSASSPVLVSGAFARPRPGGCSFGGGFLVEGRLAKFIYMDEAGTNPGAPVTVVAGVLVDPDSEWGFVDAHLRNLKLRLPNVPDDWVLHATELFSGSKVLHREEYDKDVRFPVLESLFSAARELNLPIFFAYQWQHPKEQNWVPKNEAFFRHVTTFLEALKCANQMMMRCYPDERASITAEDVTDKRQFLKGIPEIMRSASAPEYVKGPHPFDRIVDTPNFVEPLGAAPLVLADAVAFAVRHYLSGHPDGLWAMQHLTGCDDVEPMFAAGRGQAGGYCGLDWRSGNYG